NLWNILKGEMSMVGPRAYRRDSVGDEIAEMLKVYPKLKNKINLAFSVKPGVTGPWQTSGRNKLSFDKRVELDAEYARKRSISKDIEIILKTPFAMLNRW
ncbi:MAG: sugar transferase, partial [Patescibacteria group bacterium]